MNKSLFLLPFLFLLSSCYTEFGESTLYGVNDNFVVTADSLLLQIRQPLHNMPVDTLSGEVAIFRADPFVIAQILVIPEDSVDSVWVKVARDQQTMGWIRQGTFLRSAVPDDPISQSVFFLSGAGFRRFMWFATSALLLCLSLLWRRSPFYCVLVRDIPSFYPTMFVLMLGTSAALCAGIRSMAPETWMQYYFHPTLNPFALSPVLGTFVASVWMIVVLFIATLDEVFCQLQPGNAFFYLFSLAGICVACCLFFSVAGLFFPGYILLVLFAVFAVLRYRKDFAPHYVCGQCGAKMHDKGACPRCDAENV